MSRYLTVSGSCVFEFTEKKSRFIGALFPVKDAESAAQALAEKKKEYWDATHNCSAYIIGRDRGVMKFSDDGEPQGTAGMPMLNALQMSGLTDVMCISTRYFGGTLLGAGGLVRAYTRCVTGAVDKAGSLGLICEMVPSVSYDIGIGYSEYQKLDAMLRNAGLEKERSDFAENVGLTVNVPEEKCEKFLSDIREMFSGSIIPVEAERKYIMKTIDR